MSVPTEPAPSTILTAAQHEQMERDLSRLLPDGLPEPNHPLAARLGPHPEIALPEREVKVHKPRHAGHWRRFPMGGWVYWQSPARMQRQDQGQDFEVPLGKHIIAPNWGKCINHLCDGAFPGGFGCPYAVVYIGAGRFGGALWYIGHNNSEVVPVGHHFHTGDILSRPDHSLTPGWGWTELGHAPGGLPGPFGEGARYHHLFTPLWRWSKT